MLGENPAPAPFSGEGLACRRGGRLVFADLAFHVAPGGAIVLRGPNGSGKTTLLRLLAGLAHPVAGRLLWNGAPIDDVEAHAARLRFVGHLDAVKPAFTVTENLAFWASLWREERDDGAIARAMDMLDLGHLSGFPARHLSAGQRHRLALARLLVAPAALWLLDEPGNALDEKSLAALSRAIAAHRSVGGMVIVASHGAAPVTDGAVLDLGAFQPKHDPHWSDAA
jgi:heme exporter protein A